MDWVNRVNRLIQIYAVQGQPIWQDYGMIGASLQLLAVTTEAILQLLNQVMARINRT